VIQILILLINKKLILQIKKKIQTEGADDPLLKEFLLPKPLKEEEEGEEKKIIKITFYRNGFILEDGPFRPFDEPKNKEFLEQLNKGYIPKELAGVSKKVAISLVDKKGEEYIPPKPKFEPFSTKGRTLGSISTNTSSSSSTTTSEKKEKTNISNENTGYKLDTSKPTTSIQIRLPDGTTLKAKFNVDHTVGTLRKFIEASSNLKNFQLSTLYPKKILKDDDETIEKSGLKNAAITVIQQ